MTPRSRKPVMLLAGMNALDQHATSYALSQSSFSSLREEDEEDFAAAEGATVNPTCHSQAAAPVAAASSSESSSTTKTGQGTDEEASSLTSTFR